MKLILILALTMMATLPSNPLSQTTRNRTALDSSNEANAGSGKIDAQQSNSPAPQLIVPHADHHTHIWSLNASRLVTEPLMPVVELPDHLKRLLLDKEQFGGREKNPTALADLYTKDVLVLNPTGPTWLRGERGIRYVIDSTVIARLLPTAYEVDGSSGYIAGYEAVMQGASAEYVSNFLYVIRKGADAKWRISSETFTLNGPPVAKAITVEQLIAEMDAAAVKRAAVLSVAFWFGNPRRKVEGDEYANVRAENDWVAGQVARFPTRLVGLCSFNPLKDYALEELNRCTKNPSFKGLKLHLGNSLVDVLNPQHIEKLRTVFRAADEKRFPVLIHLWTTGKYGREHSEAFLNQVLPAAPNIPIQIAHMAASGPNYHSDDAFEVYANAAANSDPRMKNVFVDVASMVTRNTRPETLELVARRLRQFGLQRVLFASDRVPGFSNDSPKDAWEAFRRLPLTEKEFRTVAENVAPYMR
ncbi:MAG TPA: amidohydrolase family protein [Pyrinomonadaceae bacterium]|nr:amidohydrolase family protein [Pyrinomonadaceae bacterium]